MTELRSINQDALNLYLEGRTFREVGHSLGISAMVAQYRAVAAIQELAAEYLKMRGKPYECELSYGITGPTCGFWHKSHEMKSPKDFGYGMFSPYYFRRTLNHLRETTGRSDIQFWEVFDRRNKNRPIYGEMIA